MGPLVGLLDGPRARGAFALRCVMSPPWSLRILAESPLTLIAVVTGEVWIVHDRGESVRLGVGDVAGEVFLLLNLLGDSATCANVACCVPS